MAHRYRLKKKIQKQSFLSTKGSLFCLSHEQSVVTHNYTDILFHLFNREPNIFHVKLEKNLSPGT